MPQVNLSILGFAFAVVTSLTVVVRSAWLATAAGALIGLALSAAAARRPGHLQVTVEGPDHLALGDEANFRLTVTNRGPRPTPPMLISLASVELGSQNVYLEPIPAGGVRDDTITLTGQLRSTSAWLRVQVGAWDALDLVRYVMNGVCPMHVTVAPLRVAAPKLPVTSTNDLPQFRHSNRPGDEFGGVRPWRRGDNRRAVHWRATARHSQLVVVEPFAPRGAGLAVVVAGTSLHVEDELRIAAGAALASATCARRDPLFVVGWTDRGVSVASAVNGRLLATWFSQRVMQVPSPQDVLTQLPRWTETVVLIVTQQVTASWRSQVETLLAGAGKAVVWLDPAAATPTQLQWLEAGLVTLHQVSGLSIQAVPSGPTGSAR